MPSTAPLIACPKCRAVLGVEFLTQSEMQPCPSCDTPVLVEVFPALFREEIVTPSEHLLVAGEASCFYHATKKAAVVCDACGRFLCRLCDVDFEGRHICPRCLESGREKGKIKQLELRRLRHDKLALVLALAPLLIFYITLITAPITVFYSIRHWNSDCSIVPNRSKLCFAAALAIASLQILGWLFFLGYLLTR